MASSTLLSDVIEAGLFEVVECGIFACEGESRLPSIVLGEQGDEIGCVYR